MQLGTATRSIGLNDVRQISFPKRLADKTESYRESYRDTHQNKMKSLDLLLTYKNQADLANAGILPAIVASKAFSLNSAWRRTASDEI
jgi:hypothetical protein